MLKKILSYLGTGLAIGSVIAPLCISVFHGLDGTLVQIFGWLCASAIFGASSLIYEVERLSFPAAVAVHGCVCFGVTLLTCYLLGYGAYFAHFGELALRVLPTFVIIYTGICLCTTLYNRHSAKAISEKLRER